MHYLYIAEAMFFIRDGVGLSSFTSAQPALEKAIYNKVVRHGPSRTLKLVPIERPYATSF